MAEENKNIKGKINELAIYHTDAYALAVANGYKGTLAEWLEFLRGKSAYEIAVMHGFEGTEEEWLESLTEHTKKKAKEVIEEADASIDRMKAESKTAEANITTAEEDAIEHIAQSAADYGTIVQTTGDSVTAVMSQKAMTDIVHTVGNALTATAIGSVVNLTDASPVEHKVKVKATMPEGIDPTTIPVVATKKNLIPFPYNLLKNSLTKGGVTATVQEDGGICFNGTATGTLWFDISSNVNLGVRVINIGSEWGFVANGEIPRSGSWWDSKWRTNYDPSGYLISIQLSAGTYENMVAYPQIEKGTVSTDYVRGDGTNVSLLDENGEAELTSIPNEMSVMAVTENNVTLSARYNVDINKKIVQESGNDEKAVMSQKAVTEYIAKVANAITGTAVGNIIKLSDVSPIEHMVRVKASIPGDVTPTDVSMFVFRKNLIPFPYPKLKGSLTKGGVTATVQEDGGICFNGTSTSVTYWGLWDVNLGDKRINQVSSHGLIGNADVSTLEINSGVKYKWCTVYDNSGKVVFVQLSAGTYENMVAYPQIEIGAESSEHEKGDNNTIVYFDENAEATVKSISGDMGIVTNLSNAELSVCYKKDINDVFEDISDKLEAKCEGYGLPIIYLSGDTSSMTKDTEATLAYVYGERSGTCQMKWQGSSSIGYPKKNYTIKFDSAFEAADGWGEQKKYCLKANYIDYSHIRNVCSAKLWGKIVKSRSTPNAKLDTLVNGGAIDGFPVCVVINNEYGGLYTFNIPKDGWMLGMGSGTQEAIVSAEGGDYLANRFKGTSDTFNGAFDVEYVTDENDAAWVEASLNRLIQACVDSDGTDLDTTIAQYLDWDSAIDYFIFSCAIGHFDGCYKNYLLSTYDGAKWFFTAYDMDSVFGNQWTGKEVYSALDYLPSFFTTYNRLFELIYKYKLNEVKTRLATLTKEWGVLHEEEVIRLYSNYSAKIPKALLDEDCRIWKTIPGTTYNNLGQITDWYRRRFAYLKQWFG